jgi:hypothetical protein
MGNIKTFERVRLTEPPLSHNHDYIMKSAEKTNVTEVMLVHWLQTQFILENDQLRIKAQDEGIIILVINGRARHIIPGVVDYASLQQTILIRPVAWLPSIRRFLDLCVFSLFKIFCKRDQKHKNRKDRD